MAQVYSDRDERHSSPADFGDDAEAEKQITMPSAVGDKHPAEKQRRVPLAESLEAAGFTPTVPLFEDGAHDSEGVALTKGKGKGSSASTELANRRGKPTSRVSWQADKSTELGN